ncbi:MAG: outer membrane protein assembly factor BamB family protein [Planctomycetota bacterium]|jgi:outer membrane protein assembly factor BamB
MNRTRSLVFLSSFLGLLTYGHLAAQTSQANWPQFRGHRASGISAGPETATSWNMESGENIAWQTEIPGMGHSSPVIWGDLIFVTTAVATKGETELSSLFGSPGYGAGESVTDEGEQAFMLICLEKKTGEIIWQQTAKQAIPEAKRHPKASHANPTPACDSMRVLVSFGSEGLFCYSHEGELLWERDFGFINSGAPGYPDKDGFQWGFASSPVLDADRVYVQIDHEGESFVAALDIENGEEIWRMAREEDSTWSTPTVYESLEEGQSQLILNGYKHIGGYDLETGEERWKTSGGGDVPVPTPVVAHDMIYLTSAHGRSRPIRAVSIDAVGELGLEPEDEDYLAWIQPRRGIYMQTPLVWEDILYCCSDGGILSAYDALTGENIYRQRIGGGETGFSGSAVASAGKLYFSGESGAIFVVEAGPEFKLIATNDMGENCMATPAISEGYLFIRTRNQLVAINPE